MSEYIDFKTLDESAKTEYAKIQGKTLSPKDRMAIPQQIMPTGEPKERARQMTEVALGYTKEQAIVEANRCLQCKNQPCVSGCPVNVPIPSFIAEVAKGEFKKAVDIIKTANLLPAICGRVCPQEKQCQGQCTVGKTYKDAEKAVSIGRLERFVADFERNNNLQTVPQVAASTGKKVAVIGSGPAGLTVAADVRRAGHDVTVFEAFHKSGGVMVYGIPEFRLPKAIVAKEIDMLKKMGVEFRTNFLVGRTGTLIQLLKEHGYDAAFIGTGAGLPKFMNIEGENLCGVVSANEFLTRNNLLFAYKEKYETPNFVGKKVTVVGGGNVAMDAARTAIRLGAEVHIVYRRSEEELPARREEVHHAKEEGVDFQLLTNPVKIIGNDKGWVCGMECIRMELTEPDASGRRRPVPIPGSEFVLETDMVIMSIGTSPNPLIYTTTQGLDVNKHGCIVADENGITSRKGIFAGGDIVSGAATVILAMGAGKSAAKAIDEYLRQ